MDIQWKGAMDATLQATENTLRRLRDRQARYSAAKQRASEAYPSAFTTESATRLNVRRYDDAVEMMPPPLPAATASALTHRPSGCGGAHLHAAQLANVVAELQLERNTRIDEVRELQRRLTNEAAELRHAIAQGREEHTFLRRSVTALEEQAAFDVPQPREAAANATRLGAAKRAWMENSAMSAYSDHMNSGLYSSIRPPTMASNADGGDAMLLRRVVELEEHVRHQQGLLDDRQRRMDQSMAEIIRGQVQVEMERMRSVAREAARESAEELVKLRLTSMKEAMAADLRAMMDSSGLTNTLQRSAETYLRDVEQTWSRRMREMEMSHPRMQPLMQQGIHVREGDVNHKKLLDELELMRSHMGKMEKQMQEMDQREVSLRTAVEVVKSDLQTCVEMKTETVRQPTTSAPLEASDVHRMLDASSLHAGLEELRGRQDRQRSANDEWQRSLQERLSLLEKNHITAENERQPLRMSVEECVARMGTLAAQADALRDQVARCAGLVSDCQENVKEVVERTNRITATKEDETSTMERQHRELQRSMAAVDASVAALRKEHTATAERLCVVESNLASDRATVLPATREATAKVEALRLAVHERCLPQVESLGQRMTSVEERAREATSSTAHHEASAARINTDLRHEMLDQVKEVEARLRKLVEQVQSDDVAQYESFVSRITHAEQDIARCMARVAASAAAPIDTGKEGGNDSSAAPPTASGCTVEVVEQLLHAALAEAESRRSEQIAADIAASTRTQRLELSVATQQAELLSTRIEDVQSAQEKLSKDVASLRDMVEHPSESANAMSREVEHPTASMEKIMDERIAVLHERISEECNDRVEVLRKEMSSSRMEAIRAQVAEKLTASSISSTLAGDDDAMQHITHEVKKRLAEGVPSILAPQAPPTDVDAEDAAAAESGATRREMELLQHNVQANDVRLTARLEQLEEQLTQVEADQSEALNHLSIALRTHVESRVAEALAERPTPTAEEMEALATRVAEEVQRPLTKQVEDLHTSMDELRQRSEEHAAQEHVASLEVAVRGCEERCQQLSHDAMEAEERRATLAEELERLQGNLRHELSTLKDAPPPPPSDEKERCDRIEVALNAIMAKSDLPCPLNARVEELDDRLRHLGEDLRLVREESAHRQAELIPATSMDADSHQLSGRLAEVEVRMETMEEQSLAAAADTLATIHEIIRTCVHRFAAALQDSSSAPMTSSATPPPQTLDEVVLYLLNQLHMLGGGLQTLQRNAMATLELLEQQEMDTAVLVPLQQAVRHLSMVLQSAALRLELQPSDFDVDVGPTIASSSVAGSCLDDRLVESGVDE